ncbi:MAG: tyrosine-type recombinase/integrase [Rhodobacteraceae bacterium]|nr:tyrosine-type recombinase/integrase [Paracoccaceae bacterium]
MRILRPRAGFEKVDCYFATVGDGKKGLRHAFGIHVIASNVSLHMLQRWLGHADMKTTAIYAQAVGPEERQIAARMWRRVGDALADFRRKTTGQCCRFS